MAIKPLAVTIQFGTKMCAFAFQAYGHFQNNPENVLSCVFSNGNKLSIDFPTTLLMTRQGESVAFGYEARELFKRGSGGVYFEHFGESLYLSENFDDQTQITDGQGTEYNALEMFAKFIKILFEYITKEFETQSHNHIKTSDIKWMLTVPSVRADKSVAFFKQGWQKAHITEELVITVTYPDAALTYCLYVPPEKCNNMNFDRIKKGQRLMVVGFEEELDSFNIYEKSGDRSFNQVANFLSGSSTKRVILRSFDSFFEDLFGTWVWKCSKRIDDDLWLDIQEKIDNGLLENTMDDSKITFSTSGFVTLNEVCKEHTNSSLRNAVEISEFAPKVKCRLPRLTFESSLIKSLFDKGTDRAVHNIAQVLARSDDKEVDIIILVGYMAKSILLHRAINVKFPEKQIVVPTHAMEAALKGAVLYGFDPIVVSSIFCGAQCITRQ